MTDTKKINATAWLVGLHILVSLYVLIGLYVLVDLHVLIGLHVLVGLHVKYRATGFERSPYALPLQLAQPRHPRGTWELPLSAAVFLP